MRRVRGETRHGFGAWGREEKEKGGTMGGGGEVRHGVSAAFVLVGAGTGGSEALSGLGGSGRRGPFKRA